LPIADSMPSQVIHNQACFADNSYSRFTSVLFIKIIKTHYFSDSNGGKLFSILVKIDKTLPWIELNGTYETRKEAKRAAETFLNSLQLRILSTPEKKNKLRALAMQTHRR
jgi:hypothetical protein